jgi:hypothetical protein
MKFCIDSEEAGPKTPVVKLDSRGVIYNQQISIFKSHQRLPFASTVNMKCSSKRL